MAQTLRSQMHTGPFQFSGLVHTLATGSTAATTDIEHPFRMDDTRFDETDHESVRVLLDMEHARSIVMGKQTASQFGYGVYDVTVQAVASTEALNPDTTENSIGAVTARWFHPTPLRMQALSDLKGLERMDDMLDVWTSGNAGGESNPATNPLLSLDVNQNEQTAALEEQARTIVRGSRIIRFGFDEQHPFVARNSALTVNLNAHSDSDTNDVYETQYYVLTGGGSGWFSVLPRKEHSVNPTVDQQGQRLVQESWAYPTCNLMVDTQSTSTQPLAWSVDPQGGANNVIAQFRGIHALGGLVSLEVPEWISRGTGNNDFDLVVSVSARRWVPM